jgi:hypothetical protein
MGSEWQQQQTEEHQELEADIDGRSAARVNRAEGELVRVMPTARVLKQGEVF